MADETHGQPIDLALTREGGRDGTIAEPTFSGVMSFLRRRYSKDVSGADVAVVGVPFDIATTGRRSEEHTSELQSLMRISYAVFCLIKTNIRTLHFLASPFFFSYTH